jgi:hypothetical protein
MPLSVDAPTTAVPPLTPSPLTVEGIREMGDKSVKLLKYHMPRLIEAIVVFMARIDLLAASDGNVRSDGNIRAELRELKAAVFANVSNAAVVTQDVLDRPNVGWDAIHKLAQEQNPMPLTAPLTAVEDNPPCHGQGREGLPSRQGEQHPWGKRQVKAGQAGQAGEVHGPVVLVAFHAGDAIGQGQAEEGLPAQPPGGGLHGL